MTESSANWRAAFSVYAQPRVLGMIMLGFSAGLPFLAGFHNLVGMAWRMSRFPCPS